MCCVVYAATRNHQCETNVFYVILNTARDVKNFDPSLNYTIKHHLQCEKGALRLNLIQWKLVFVKPICSVI